MAEFTIGERRFRFGAIDCFEQIEIVGRLMEVGDTVKELIPRGLEFLDASRKTDTAAAEAAQSADPESADKAKVARIANRIEAIWDLVGPVAKTIGGMKPEDKRFVIEAALKVTQFKDQSGEWGDIWNAEAGMFQYAEFKSDGPLVLMITLRVLGGALNGFFDIALPAFVALLVGSSSK